MPFVKCSVDGCSRKLQPILKVDPRDRDTWFYRECEVCLKPACEKHSSEESRAGSSATAAAGRPKPNSGQRGLSTSDSGCDLNQNKPPVTVHAGSGTTMNASPARTMIGSVRSTQPPSPTVAVASRPSRSPVPGSIL